jgi:hypothetical protein
MNLNCPACDWLMTAKTEPKPGTQVTCQVCGERFVVPDPEIETADVWAEGEEAHVVSANQHSTGRSKGVAATDKKICPMCGEQVPVKARTCTRCGEKLVGFQGQDGYAIEEVWRDGKRLVMSKTARLPAICVKTNQPTARRMKMQIFWHHPLVYLSLLGGVLLYAILALIIRESAKIEIGLSAERLSRRRWSIFGGWMGSFAGLGFIIWGIAVGSRHVAPVLIIGGIVVLLVAVIAGSILSSTVSPAKITRKYVWLRGVHPEYLAALPDFPGE